MRLFSTLPGELISIFKGLGNAADAINAKAYLIGAYPRSILFREDCSDLEVVITGDIERTIDNFVNSYKMLTDKTIKTAGRYFHISNPYSEGDFIKIARTRKDMSGGAGDIKSETFCRGFSIDALAVCLNSIDFGNIVDYAGAVQDLENRILRSLTRDLFSNEPVYLFKAIAYKTKYGLSTDPITDTLWKRAIKEKTFHTIPQSDLKHELHNIRKEKNGKEELRTLKELMGV